MVIELADQSSTDDTADVNQRVQQYDILDGKAYVMSAKQQKAEAEIGK